MLMKDAVKLQHNTFQTNKTKDIQFRIDLLKKLYQLIQTHEYEISSALKSDLGKSDYESYMTEIGIVLSEIRYQIKNINKWSKPIHVATPLALFPSTSKILKEPYGVVLVLAPWNYPFQLAMVPAIGALGAGNCVLIKASRSSSNTASLMKKLINENFDPSIFYVIDQNEDYDSILSEKVDYIFFTGSERVGKTIMKAASEHCTPVTLELGGKSPVFVHSSADLQIAAKRIIWGKSINSGQTCVAPDYVLVDHKIHKEFIEALQVAISNLHPDSILNSDYPNIINENHYSRLKALIEKEYHRSEVQYDEEQHKISLVLFKNTSFDDEIMKEEIFGPILPVISVTNWDETIDTIKRRPKPLACYVFSQDQVFTDRIHHDVSFGGGCVNDVVMHLANHHLPFGGVGSSGLGNYHGKASFDTFTHQKSVLTTPKWPDLPFRYMPYRKSLLKLIKMLLR